MPLQATSGAASYDAFGGGVPVVPNYIEECFSCFLYTGTDTTSTGVLSINNSIDLAGKGGLVWIKARNTTTSQALFDTTRGTNKLLTSNSTAAQTDESPYTLGAFNANGFSLGSATLGSYALVNGVGNTYASWTFRKQPKFFDVVTYTGNGATSRNISHNLGSDPGCIIVKRTSAANDWSVYHRSTGTGKRLILNDTLAVLTDADMFASVTSTTFSVSGNTDLNDNGATYVAYLFAHNAGGFGLTGTDNVISCGSYTGTGAVGPSVNLGYEPQWLLIKRATGTSAISGWYLLDNMRGIPLSGGSNYLRAETSDAETNNTYAYATPTATGFNVDPSGIGLTGVNFSGETYIYIAIRRGPMKVPTSGTSVFIPITSSATTGTTLTTTFPVDMQIAGYRTIVDSGNRTVVDRLRGASSTTTSTGQALLMSSTATETSASVARNWDNTGFQFPSYWSGDSTIFYSFRRAPSFFDEVCYTGTGVARTVTHNLTVVPELLIVKSRTQAGTFWTVQVSALGPTKCLYLQTTDSVQTRSSPWNDTAPTSSVFTVGTDSDVNGSGQNIVAYLFATCAGVSKVGSYTGTATTKQIDCGFTGGARFVLIKRTDSTGSWYVWDSSRGIVSGNDPYLLLNSTAAEVTNTDYIDAYSAGFEISSTAPAEINASGGTYIFLSIA
jgi:hypothetical protein